MVSSRMALRPSQPSRIHHLLPGLWKAEALARRFHPKPQRRRTRCSVRRMIMISRFRADAVRAIAPDLRGKRSPVQWIIWYPSRSFNIQHVRVRLRPRKKYAMVIYRAVSAGPPGPVSPWYSARPASLSAQNFRHWNERRLRYSGKPSTGGFDFQCQHRTAGGMLRAG